MKSKSLLILSLCIVAFVGLASCSGAKSKGGSSTSGSNGSPIEVQPEPEKSYFYIHGVAPSEEVAVFTHNGDFATQCRVDLDATSSTDRDVSCYIEMKEFDEQFHGVDLKYNVPKNRKCAYMRYTPYYFYAYPANKGPTAVTKVDDGAGNITITVDPGGYPAGTVNSIYEINGEPVCHYNYAQRKEDDRYPNCCQGKYQLTLTTPSGTTVTEADWGGKIGNCLGGAGATFKPDETYSFPSSEILFLGRGTGLMSSSPIDPISLMSDATIKIGDISLLADSTTGTYSQSPQGLSKSASNIHTSNYFDSTFDLDDATLAGLDAFEAPSQYSGLSGHPSYMFQCFDEAYEQYARIKIYIREWNEDAEFDKLLTGDFNTGEPSDLEDYWNGRRNDVYDWNNLFELSTPITDPASDYPGYPGDWAGNR